MREPSELAIIGAAAVEHGELKRKLTDDVEALSAYRNYLRFTIDALGEFYYGNSSDIASFHKHRLAELPTGEMLFALVTKIQNTRTRIEELEGILRTAGCAPDAVQVFK